jgi:hypothetical protein
MGRDAASRAALLETLMPEGKASISISFLSIVTGLQSCESCSTHVHQCHSFAFDFFQGRAQHHDRVATLLQADHVARPYAGVDGRFVLHAICAGRRVVPSSQRRRRARPRRTRTQGESVSHCTVLCAACTMHAWHGSVKLARHIRPLLHSARNI